MDQRGSLVNKMQTYIILPKEKLIKVAQVAILQNKWVRCLGLITSCVCLALLIHPQSDML
jgi:hypothetical protein